jgi:hypothetical protein
VCKSVEFDGNALSHTFWATCDVSYVHLHELLRLVDGFDEFMRGSYPDFVRAADTRMYKSGWTDVVADSNTTLFSRVWDVIRGLSFGAKYVFAPDSLDSSVGDYFSEEDYSQRGPRSLSIITGFMRHHSLR